MCVESGDGGGGDEEVAKGAGAAKRIQSTVFIPTSSKIQV